MRVVGATGDVTAAWSARALVRPQRPASSRRTECSARPSGYGTGRAEAEVRFIHKHFRPQTRRFWIPDAFFGGAGDTLSLTAVGHALVAGETLFVNTYLIGVTTFAAARRPRFARFMAELAGVEAEHRVLAQTLIDAVPPNDVGFEAFRFRHVHAIVTALEQAGVGFGRKGSSPGRFYNFPRPPMPPPLPIRSNEPR